MLSSIYSLNQTHLIPKTPITQTQTIPKPPLSQTKTQTQTQAVPTRPSHELTPEQVPGPKDWGPHVWYVMDIFAKGYGDNPSPALKRDANDFFRSLANLLPCEECRTHYATLLKQRPVSQNLQNSEVLLNWVSWIKAEVTKTIMASKKYNNGIGNNSATNSYINSSNTVPNRINPKTISSQISVPNHNSNRNLVSQDNNFMQRQFVKDQQLMNNMTPKTENKKSKRKQWTEKERYDETKRRYKRPCFC